LSSVPGTRRLAVVPVHESERLTGLDVVRGVAVLGILVINVQLFAMPYAASSNPYAVGQPSASDLLVWSIAHVLADQKFITIFSLLFGAGVLLMTSRAAAGGASPARLHYRRMAWLLVFGLGHAYLLWHGDILVLYAVCGMALFAMRNRSTRVLTVAGLVSLIIGSAIMLYGGLTMDTWPVEVMAEWQRYWSPSPEDIAAETAAFQAGWWSQQDWRASYSAEYHLQEMLIWDFWRVGGLMLLGMALFKAGILSGGKTASFYKAQTALALGIGLPMVAWGLTRYHATGWNMRDSIFLVPQWNYWGSILVSLGYIGLLLTLVKAGVARHMVARLSAVGRMAFSCYIAETLISTFVFYGHGLGRFGTVDRLWQMLFTAGVWVVLLIAAPLWLARFRYGPLEWLWRSLTYGRVEPMQRR
jgi:uncharacterized protein